MCSVFPARWARISRASVICPGRNSSHTTTGSTPIRIIGSWSASGAASAAGPRWRFSTRSKKAGTRISSRSAPRSNPNPGCCWWEQRHPRWATHTRCMRERPSSRARNTCSQVVSHAQAQPSRSARPARATGTRISAEAFDQSIGRPAQPRMTPSINRVPEPDPLVTGSAAAGRPRFAPLDPVDYQRAFHFPSI